MANVVKYNDVNWGEGTPIAGERLATNGHYTGEHIGAPIQDAKGNSESNAAHYRETGIVRLGTMMGDAMDENYPTTVEAASEE